LVPAHLSPRPSLRNTPGLDIELEEVVQLNIAELADRQRRGMIGGSGDGR
jgi:hypothetical protein